MFDEILKLVKEQLGNHPDVAPAIPPGQADAIHNEIATHVANGLANSGAAATAPSGGGILSMLENSIAGGGSVVNAIEGSLINSLASKFGLPVTLEQIMEANPRISPTKLHPGQLLVIPAALATQPQSPR